MPFTLRNKHTVCPGRCVFVSSALVKKSEPELYTAMSNTSLNHLKKENDKLKDEIAALKNNFGVLQQLLDQPDELSACNGGHKRIKEASF